MTESTKRQVNCQSITSAEDILLVVALVHVEDVLGVEHPLPDGERDALVALLGVEDALVIGVAESGLDEALKPRRKTLLDCRNG